MDVQRQKNITYLPNLRNIRKSTHALYHSATMPQLCGYTRCYTFLENILVEGKAEISTAQSPKGNRAIMYIKISLYKVMREL